MCNSYFGDTYGCFLIHLLDFVFLTKQFIFILILLDISRLDFLSEFYWYL